MPFCLAFPARVGSQACLGQSAPEEGENNLSIVGSFEARPLGGVRKGSTASWGKNITSFIYSRWKRPKWSFA